MSRETRGLGKGLSALLGENNINPVGADQFRKPVGYVNKEIAGSPSSSSRRENGSDVMRIPVDMIEANPWQPRMSFDQEALEELAASIRSLGLIQPITVRRVAENRFQIISGERRFKACRLAGMTMVPAFVRDAADQGMLEMAIVENVQREDLDPIETALSYQRLIDECKLTQEQMADRLGKKRSSVANFLRLLKLPVKVQHDLKVGLLSVGHAKVILGVDDPETQEKLCDIVITDGLNVRALEELVRKILAGQKVPDKKSASKTAPASPAVFEPYRERLSRYFSAGVSVKQNTNGAGSLTMKFASEEELGRFLQILDRSGL